MKKSTKFALMVVLGVAYGALLELVLNPFGGYLQWTLFGLFTLVAALLSPTILRKLLAGVGMGAVVMLVIYLFAYFTGALGQDANEYFLLGLLIAAVDGVQYGLISGIVAVGLHLAQRPLNKVLAR